MRKVPGSAPFFIVGINRGLRGYWTGKFFSTNTADAVPFENQRIATNALLKARKTLAEQGGWAQAVKVKLGIVAHDADYGENPATRSQARMHRAYRVAVAADKKFARELKRQFGRNAVMARYRDGAHNEYDARTAKAYRQFMRANARNLKEARRENPAPRIAWQYFPGSKSYKVTTGGYGAYRVTRSRGKWSLMTEKIGEEPLVIGAFDSKREIENYLTRLRQNPVPPLQSRIDAAGRAYSEFTGHRVKGARRVNVKNFRVGWPLGKLDGVMYSTVRDGKAEKYIHRFRSRSRPLLAVSSDGTQLGIVGGQFQVTEAGIEDS